MPYGKKAGKKMGKMMGGNMGYKTMSGAAQSRGMKGIKGMGKMLKKSGMKRGR